MLKNLKFSTDEPDAHIGLPFLLNEATFDDAFILHDPTNHYFHLVDMIDQAKKNTAATKPGDADDMIDDDGQPYSVDVIHRLEANDGKQKIVQKIVAKDGSQNE